MNLFNRLNLFRRSDAPADKPVEPVQPAQEEEQPVDALQATLDSAEQKIKNISDWRKKLRHAKTPEKKATLESKIDNAIAQFSTEFGVGYDPNFQIVSRSLKSGQGSPTPENLNSATPVASEPDDVTPDKVPTPLSPEPLDQTIAKQSPETEKSGPAPVLNYRQHLENLKAREGGIKSSEYANFEIARQDLAPELAGLTESLLSEKMTREVSEKVKDFVLDPNIQSLVAKTGLTAEEIREIYQNNEELIIAEAKEEINKKASKVKTIGRAAGKYAFYLGSGIGMAATLGTSGLISAGLIAVARVADRIITEKRDNKKLNEKLKEVKAGKTEEDKLALQDRLAAAISLKKKMEISRVDLQGKVDRTKIIDEYIEEQGRAGLLDIEPGQVMEYKDKIVRVMEGLDDIDKFNQEQEDKLNKKSWLDKISKLEKTVYGSNSRERVVSTAVIIGMGIAAREVPVIRNILSAYAGYRIGGLIGDSVAKQVDHLTDLEDKNSNDYYQIRQKLLDQDFRKNNPQEYLKLKERVGDLENYKLRFGGDSASYVSQLNQKLSENLKFDKSEARLSKVIKFAPRVGGAVVGWLGGDIANKLLKDVFTKKPVSGSGAINHSGVHHDSTDAVNKAISNKPAVADSSSVTTPAGGKIPNADTVNVVSKPGAGLPPSAGGHLPESLPKNNSALEAVISHGGLKSGHSDSVWHATNQIFKDHAAELGYKGDIKDAKALEAWSQLQTGKALNNSGAIDDKVFAGNKVVLEHDAAGHYHVAVEKGEGLNPAHLARHAGNHPDAPVAPQPDSHGSHGAEYDELKRQYLEKSKADFRQKYEFVFHDKYGHPASGVTPDSLVGSSDAHSGSETINSVIIDQHNNPGPDFTNEALHHSAAAGGHGAGEVSPDITKSGQGVEVPVTPQGKAEIDSLVTGEATKKIFSSLDNLKDLPNGTKTNLGELVMTKRDGVYHFARPNQEKFDLVFNRLGEVGQNDKFTIIQAGHVLDGHALPEAITLKREIYFNLPDKRTSLARELLKEILKDQEQTK
jgi:hypothetical protein